MNHREIIELLPWYVNATLKGAERQAVEKHLADCGECMLELEGLKAMKAAAIELNEEALAPSPSLLNRALVQIEQYEQVRARVKEKRAGFFAAFLGLIAAFSVNWWRPTPFFARVVIVAQLALAVTLGGLLVRQHNRSQTYTTLSGPSGTVAQEAGTRLSLGFSEGVSEEVMRQTIQAIHGKIVAGPSALGLYTVEVPVPPERSDEIEKLLLTLRQNHRVIRFAERQM